MTAPSDQQRIAASETAEIGHAATWLSFKRLAPYRTSETTLRVVVAAFVLLPILWSLENLLPPLNFDVAAILEFSEQWLRGQKLYVDLVDVNPPLIFLLETIPVLLAWAFGFDPPTWMGAMTIGLGLLSLGLFYRLTSVVERADRSFARTLVPLTAAFALLVLPFEGFAQREHLVLLMTLPYLQLAAARVEGIGVSRALVGSVAVLAAIGFAIKPHFLPAAILVELYVFVSLGPRRAFRDAVPWTMFGTWVAYLLYALLVTPEYFTETLPLVAKFYLNVGGETPASLLLSRTLVPLALGLGALGLVAFAIVPSPLLRALIAFAAGAGLAAIVQAKGWSHHYYPLKASMLLAVVVVGASVLDRIVSADPAQRRAPLAVLVALAMGAAYVPAAMNLPPLQRYRDFQNSDAWHLMSIVKRYAGRQPILVLSPGIEPHYPMMNYAEARMAMDFQTMWALQGAYNECEQDAPLYRETQDMGELERKVFNGVAEDFAANRPALVIVDSIPGIPRCHAEVFSYLDYFMRHPLFAHEWPNYAKLTEYKRYVIYRRR
jgi:hypothetical protein